jgi:hypothetical protein
MTIEVALNDGGARVLVEVTFPQCSLSTDVRGRYRV